MRPEILIARAEADPAHQESQLLRAPSVGVMEGLPPVGTFINAGSRLGTLRVLDRRHDVHLPRQLRGWVTERLLDGTYLPVDFGQPLLRLSTAVETQEMASMSQPRRESGASTNDEGWVSVTAPSQGVFYSRPGPDSPPYVAVGSMVSTGSVLGLVEVMKCFNQVTYGGPGLPERGKVVRIMVTDTSEVAFGQTMFLIQPA